MPPRGWKRCSAKRLNLTDSIGLFERSCPDAGVGADADALTPSYYDQAQVGVFRDRSSPGRIAHPGFALPRTRDADISISRLDGEPWPKRKLVEGIPIRVDRRGGVRSPL